MDKQKFSNDKTKLPPKNLQKKDTTKTIRISERHYEALRNEAFNQRITMRELLDNILEQSLKFNRDK